jgi:hypothetical protein
MANDVAHGRMFRFFSLRQTKETLTKGLEKVHD